jgi:membrane protein DedA with SNARE-associated domain
MIDFIEWLRIFILNHRSFEYVIIFGGAMLGGEFALFVLGFLSAQGILPITPVILLSFFASFLPNILWFLLGKTAIVGKIISHRYANKTVLIITEAMTRVSKGNHFMGLIVTKFLVGTPVILTTYVNKTGLKFWQFLFYETPAILLSLFVYISIGFLSGLGFIYLAEVLKNIYAAIGFVLFIIIIIIMIQIWLEKYLSKRSNIKIE